MPNLIIGSRGSKLALWQSNWVKSEIERAHPGADVAIKVIKTTGDKLTEASLVKIGGKGVFTKEIEEALLDGSVDLAVHSLKDLPTTLPDRLHIAAITRREDVRDALLVHQTLRDSVKTIRDLPHAARVGTSSLRRASQLRHLRPDLRIIELRGNVETRLRKLGEGDYDAIILASAGLIRLGYGDRITAHIERNEMLSAVGQGALGIETRLADARTNLLLEFLNHWPTRYVVEAERAVLRELGGGCAVPIAALGVIQQHDETETLTLEALVADAEGKRLLRQQATSAPAQWEAIGAQLAQRLIKLGARDLLPRIGGSAAAAGETGSNQSQVELALTGASQTESPASQTPAPHQPVQPSSTGTAQKSSGQNADPQPRRQTSNNTRGADRPAGRGSIRATVRGELNKRPKLVSRKSSAPQRGITRTPASEAQRSTPSTAPISVDPTIATNLGAFRSEPTRPASLAKKNQKPLAGRRIVVTRSIKQSGEITRALEQFGAEVIACPTIEIKPPTTWDQLDRALIHLSWYDWLVFTSSNGVEYFLKRLDELGHGRAELMSHKVCAVGKKTAEKLKSENITVDLMPERFTAESVVETFIKSFGVRQRLRGSRMLLPASRTTRDVIRPALEKIGVYVEIAEAYQTVLPATANAEIAQLFQNANADYVIFTSPSTVANLAALLEADHLAPHLANSRIACIGPVTAEAARLHGLTVHIQPEEHTAQAIVMAIVGDAANSDASGKN